MDMNTADAGAGNETASQVEAVDNAALAPEAAPETKLEKVLPQPAANVPENGTQETKPVAKESSETDPLNALKPQTPEEAAKVGAEGEPVEEKKEGEAEPVPLELKLPDGYPKDDPVLAEYMDIARKGNIDQETAQKLFDMHHAAQQNMTAAFEKGIHEERARINTEWARQCQTDPELGGERYEESCNYLTAAIRRFVPDPKEQAEFVDFYSRANLQNAPMMFRFLARVGKATSEAGAVTSDASNVAREAKSIKDMFYPGMNLK